MQIELPKSKNKIPICINMESISYVYANAKKPGEGTIIMVDGSKIKVLAGIDELKDRIQNLPHFFNLLR